MTPRVVSAKQLTVVNKVIAGLTEHRSVIAVFLMKDWEQ